MQTSTNLILAAQRLASASQVWPHFEAKAWSLRPEDPTRTGSIPIVHGFLEVMATQARWSPMQMWMLQVWRPRTQANLRPAIQDFAAKERIRLGRSLKQTALDLIERNCEEATEALRARSLAVTRSTPYGRRRKLARQCLNGWATAAGRTVLDAKSPVLTQRAPCRRSFAAKAKSLIARSQEPRTRVLDKRSSSQKTRMQSTQNPAPAQRILSEPTTELALSSPSSQSPVWELRNQGTPSFGQGVLGQVQRNQG